MNLEPLISIIVPCYNQAIYLDEALDSILKQTYSNWECIIVNDGSSDETDVIAKQWVFKDNRFKYFYKKNGGLSSARNYGIEKSSGDWVQFLDSDDCLHEEKFNNSIKIINNFPKINCVVSNYVRFYDKVGGSKSLGEARYDQKSLTYKSILFQWGGAFIIPIHCGFFKMDIIKEFKFDESFKAIEDWIMWLNYFKRTEEVYFVNKPLAYYRNNQNSMTKNHSFMQESLVKAYKHIFGELINEYAEEFMFTIIERQSSKIAGLRNKIDKLEYRNKNYIMFLLKKFKNKILMLF